MSGADEQHGDKPGGTIKFPVCNVLLFWDM